MVDIKENITNLFEPAAPAIDINTFIDALNYVIETDIENNNINAFELSEAVNYNILNGNFLN